MVLGSKILGSKRGAVYISILAVVIIGIGDYLTGADISLVLFYLGPICYVTWVAGRYEGMLISVLAITVSFSGDFVVTGRIFVHPGISYWNGFMRAGVFLIVVQLASRLKTALLREKEISQVRSDMLALVGRLNTAMTSNSDLESVGKALLDTITIFFPTCAGTIRLLDWESGLLEPLASASLDESEWKKEAPGWTASADFTELKAPIIVRNVQSEPGFWNTEFCRRNGLVSYLGFPLIAAGEFLGIISLYTRKAHDFTDEEIIFFKTLAGQAAIALQNARLFKQVHSGHAQLRELSRRLLDVQEIDRRHIATELHDEIGQILTGLKLTLAMNGRALYEENGASLGKAQAMIDDLIKKVRGMSLDLRPSMLDDLGLLPTLLWYMDRYTSMTAVKINFNHQGVEGHRFDPRVETAVYRIVQEALTNVARHARVNEAAVQVWCTPDTVFVEIQDTGAGFNVETALRAGNSVGLTGMRERARLLGGELHIESAPSTGTCIIADLPAAKLQEIPTNP